MRSIRRASLGLLAALAFAGAAQAQPAPSYQPFSYGNLPPVDGTSITYNSSPALTAVPGGSCTTPGPSTLGCVDSLTATSHQWIYYLDTSGVFHQSQPAFGDLSGNISTSQMNGGTGASSSTFWRGDGTWSSTPGCGTPGPSTLGCVFSLTSASHQWLSYLDTTGAFHQSQPAFSDLSGSIGATQLIAPTTSAWGAIEAISCPSHQWIGVIPTTQVQPTCAQPAFSDLSGSIGASQLIAPTTSAWGAIEAISCPSHQWIDVVPTTQAQPTCAQPAFSDLSGSIGASQLIAPTTSSWGAIEAISCSSGQFVQVIPTTQVQPTCAAPSGGSSANPSATIGLGAVNGSASTFMTSDSAPPLSQSIVPTWTGKHTFQAVPAFTAGNSQTSGTFGPEGALYSITATQSTSTGTGEQTLATYSLPANALDVAGRNIRVRAWFKHAANSHTVTFKLYFGSESESQASTSSNQPFLFEADILKTGSNTQNVIEYGLAGGGSPSVIAPTVTAATETDTSAITIKATATDGTSSAGDGTLVYFTVEYLN